MATVGINGLMIIALNVQHPVAITNAPSVIKAAELQLYIQTRISIIFLAGIIRWQPLSDHTRR